MPVSSGWAGYRARHRKKCEIGQAESWQRRNFILKCIHFFSKVVLKIENRNTPAHSRSAPAYPIPFVITGEESSILWYDARATASPRRRVLALTSGTTCPVVVFPASATTPRRPHRNGTYTTVPAAPRATKWYAARPRRPAGGRDIKMCPATAPTPPWPFPAMAVVGPLCGPLQWAAAPKTG